MDELEGTLAPEENEELEVDQQEDQQVDVETPEGEQKPEGEEKTEQEEQLDSGKFSPEQIGQFVNSLGLPKGVDHFVDENDGSLKFVLSIDGKKYVQTPSEVVRGFGLNQAGHMKLEEAKQVISGNRKFYETAKDDPKKFWDLADKIGIDKRQLAYEYLNSVVEEEEMSKEQKLERENKQFRKEKEDFEAQQKKQKEEAEYTELRNQEISRLNEEFKEALPSLGFKNYSPRTKMVVVNSAIEKIKFYGSMGKDLSIKDAVSLAKQEKMSLIQDYFGELDDQRLEDTIPKAIIDRVRAMDLAKLSKNQGGIPTSSAQLGGRVDLKEIDDARAKSTGKKKPVKQSLDDYFHNLK